MRVISRLGRFVTLALLATFAWKLFRRRRSHPVYAPSYEAPYVLEQGPARRDSWAADVRAASKDTLGAARSAARWSTSTLVAGARRLRLPRSDRSPGPADLDSGRVEFEWLVRTSAPLIVEQALTAAGIEFQTLDPSEHDRADEVEERLEAVGMHLDEGGSGAALPALARYSGATSPRRLTDAFGRASTDAHTGFIVDVDASGSVTIDEHQTVGSGVLALLEPTQARLVHGERARAFFRAVRDASERRGAAS